jgi:BirA family biotin operon repressor/biotin-[acetyl-CoA-carboxylase] ligase
MSETSPDVLDAARICAAMSSAARESLSELTVLAQVDSTNSAVSCLPGDQQHAHAVLTDHQTDGRGRRQRSWHSPPGGNIYLSLGWRFAESERPLSTLPLVVAVAVCRALSRSGLKEHGIKWPNDILVEGRKLAGILVELQSAGAGPATAVIGIGLNVQMPGADSDELEIAIDRPWTDLATELGDISGDINRNQLSAWILDELLESLNRFESDGFPAFSSEWQDLDLLHGREICVEQGGREFSGRARGVDQDGGLLLETAPSMTRVFHSGEVSVHHG